MRLIAIKYFNRLTALTHTQTHLHTHLHLHFTFSHLADAFVQSDVQGRELVEANWKAVLSTEHISHLTQTPRSYRDLISDRWIQSPECYPLHLRTVSSFEVT